MSECSPLSPIFDRPRQCSLRFAIRTSTRSSSFAKCRKMEPIARRCIDGRSAGFGGNASPQLKRSVCGAQIPIARAAPPLVPPARFLPLEAFGRRPPVSVAPLVNGRHPKPFTRCERLSKSRSFPLCLDKQTLTTLMRTGGSRHMTKPRVELVRPGLHRSPASAVATNASCADSRFDCCR